METCPVSSAPPETPAAVPGDVANDGESKSIGWRGKACRQRHAGIRHLDADAAVGPQGDEDEDVAAPTFGEPVRRGVRHEFVENQTDPKGIVHADQAARRAEPEDDAATVETM